MAFPMQKMNYTVNIWFNFVFGSFCEHDHLLNFLLNYFRSLCQEITCDNVCMSQNITCVKIETYVAQNLIDDIFF